MLVCWVTHLEFICILLAELFTSTVSVLDDIVTNQIFDSTKVCATKVKVLDSCGSLSLLIS